MNKSRVVILSFIVVLVIAAGAAGWFAGHRQNAAQPAASANADRKVLYWKAPMNPDFHSDKPGKSPMGMDLVPVYADGGGDKASDVTVSSATVNNLSVRTAEVKQGTLAHRIESVGYVAYNENTIRSIHTRAEGWLEKLAVKSEGDRVKAGQLLYELFSPKLATAEQEYLTAAASGNRSLANASRERLLALGFTEAQIRQLAKTHEIENRVARRATDAGVVAALGVREGAYVTPATDVMKLAKLDTVWMLVEIDASQAGLVAKGQTAIASFDAYPGKTWKGTVDYIYPDVSPVTRTIKARILFGNPRAKLQPNMFGHVTIQAAPEADAIYIPIQALIRTGESQRVVVALGDGRFDICPVQAGFQSGDSIQILKGLQPGQRVVVSSQFMLDSEANVNAAALRIGGKPGCSQAPAMNMPSMSNMPHDETMTQGGRS